MPREARFHLDDFFRFDAQLMCNVRNLRRRQRLAARLHAAQIEEQLALRFSRRHLDHAPVFQHVLVDLGLDPVNRERHQTYAVRRIKAFDGLHQTDIALLDQIGVRQTVAQIAPRNRNDQAKVGKNQLARRFDIFFFAKLRRQPKLFLLAQDRKLFGCLNVSIDIAYGRDHRKSQRLRHVDLHLPANTKFVQKF